MRYAIALAVILASACKNDNAMNTPGNPVAAASRLVIYVDSVRHVACYRRPLSEPLACVVLDSTNSVAIGR